MQRQSDLSLKEIISILKGEKTSNYPTCMLLNELGIICFEGRDMNDEGVNLLSTFLNSENANKRYISFSFLLLIPGAEDKFSKELKKFRSNNSSKELIFQAEAMIATSTFNPEDN